MDLIIENLVVVEVKAEESILPVHKAQLLTYLKLSGFPLGFVANFNIPLIKDGLHRLILRT